MWSRYLTRRLVVRKHSFCFPALCACDYVCDFARSLWPSLYTNPPVGEIRRALARVLVSLMNVSKLLWGELSGWWGGALGSSLSRAQKEMTLWDPAALRLWEGSVKDFSQCMKQLIFLCLNKHSTYNYPRMALKQKAHVECQLCSWHGCKPNGS